MRKKIIIFGGILLLLALITFLLLWKYTDNTTLQVTTYQITDGKIPSAFDVFRIAQVADLHNTEFGEGNADLLSLLEESEPDIIVFTGDQVDVRRTNLDVVVRFAEEAVQIAPCYMVTGNHEGSILPYGQLKADLEALGVTILEDEVLELQRGEDELTLIGVEDPTMSPHYLEVGLEGSVDDALAELSWNENTYSILLSHHPEYFEVYEKHGVDLALCGHAHGGQLRIGSLGIIAPHQGLFPRYDAGRYDKNNTTMILSRGLGNSAFPWRINNPPELVMVELLSDQ